MGVLVLSSTPFWQIRRGPIKPEWISFSWKTVGAKCTDFLFLRISLALLAITDYIEKETSGTPNLKIINEELTKPGYHHLILWHSQSLSLISPLSQHGSNDNVNDNISTIIITIYSASTIIVNILLVVSSLIQTTVLCNKNKLTY